MYVYTYICIYKYYILHFSINYIGKNLIFIFSVDSLRLLPVHALVQPIWFSCRFLVKCSTLLSFIAIDYCVCSRYFIVWLSIFFLYLEDWSVHSHISNHLRTVIFILKKINVSHKSLNWDAFLHIIRNATHFRVDK